MAYQLSALIFEIPFNYTTLYFLFPSYHEQAIVWNMEYTRPQQRLRNPKLWMCALCVSSRADGIAERKDWRRERVFPRPEFQESLSPKPFLEFISTPQADNNKELLSLWLQPPGVNHSLINLERNDQVRDALLFRSPGLLQTPPHSTLPHVWTLRHWNTFPVIAVTALLLSSKSDLKDYHTENISKLRTNPLTMTPTPFCLLSPG